MTTDLWGLSLTQLKEMLALWGEAPYRAEQIYNWLYTNLALSVDEMTNLPADLRHRLSDETNLQVVRISKRQASDDDAALKLLFTLHDGHSVEGVLLKYDRWYSACLSSQVGCRMGCSFCASGLGGFVRQLTTAEMMGQLVMLSKEAQERGGKIRSVVMMGSGEPLDNYDHVLSFLNRATNPIGLGIGWRRMTLSTCGLIPGVKRLARERLPITLAVSLHAPTDPLRTELMPINKRYSLGPLMSALREYAAGAGRRITFEYVLIDRINDAISQAHQLVKLVRPVPCHVNLIPFNTVPELSFKRPSPGRIKAFYNVIKEQGIPVTIRRELGGDITAACGQLRRRGGGRREPRHDQHF